ncbi:hypothetical protein [Armatimonas rosea]|uniref:Uncharacterized protein n=1 Tax=Armatimonas rosea TaxID=685828 RepID=A0A7W9W8E5_ARMRO|nr:hypothetical protein [Armatimonas rosea]MBB6051512.1 hypothetical protein [Armatimonas rosea]
MQKPHSVSGIYPHLAMFNDEGECGTGAVVVWAGRLWAVTYAPHKPTGSSDKLYELTPDLKQTIRPESIGGTPANRFIHRESQQLFIGPYVIDATGKVRTIPYSKMFGRHTGNARHLTDPKNKVYCATMEEGLYELDVHSLAVTELWADEQQKTGRKANLPGYHGKGLYSGQGRVVYANNGEHGDLALVKPDIPSGCLAEWSGQEWRVVRRNQFTEVTGPGGIEGNKNDSDPLWSIGWDHRSLILQVLDGGKWHSYRLPKASHCYDGAHGWNTEWPRIREIGERDLLMTMHGTLWRFPRGFRPSQSAGIAPRSTYLKVIGDFCRWGERVVFGCDDTAKNEFLNKRAAKGKLAGPGQSQSNLWFVEPKRLDHLGPAFGRGALWLKDMVAANTPSDAFLLAGYAKRGLHITHTGNTPVTVTLELDERGDNRWRTARKMTLPPQGTLWTELKERGAWLRLRTDKPCQSITAVVQYRNLSPSYLSPQPPPPGAHSSLGKGESEIAPFPRRNDCPHPGGTRGLGRGLLYARGANLKTLRAVTTDGGVYDLDESLTLRRIADPTGAAWAQANYAIPQNVLQEDAASVIYTDEQKQRWRLPKFQASEGRVCREVCTERDLFHAHGTFYELPAENAGGFAKIRPITTHDRALYDYASWRGLLVVSGIVSEDFGHIVRSDDGKLTFWLGVVDDLWALGKPQGEGGPWKGTLVRAQVPSDPYLMTGYDKKTLQLEHQERTPRAFRIEVDITGSGLWVPYERFTVAPGKPLVHTFPAAFGAYWVRCIAEQDATATARFIYA